MNSSAPYWKGTFAAVRIAPQLLSMVLVSGGAAAVLLGGLSMPARADNPRSLADLQKQVRNSACTGDFNSTWDRSALVAYQKIGIYTSAIDK